MPSIVNNNNYVLMIQKKKRKNKNIMIITMIAYHIVNVQIINYFNMRP